MRRRFLTGKLLESRGIAEIQWHGTELNKPLWNDPEAKFLAFTLAGADVNESDLHVVLNMSDQQIVVDLPAIAHRQWCVAMDTSLTSPHDIVLPQDQTLMRENFYSVNSRTIVVFENICLLNLKNVMFKA